MARKPASSDALAPVRTPLRAGVPSAVQAQAWPDAWATRLKLAVDGHPFDLVGREYQQQIIRDEHPYIVMPKGAQLGLTTIFLIRTFHWMTKRGWQHLYLMPLKTGTVAFVQGRINPIIESNPELDGSFKSVSNRMHKQTKDKINLHVRGTNILTELREVPSDVLVLDERDKMIEDNLPEAFARLDGSPIQRVTELSTPTAPGHGVDSEDGWHITDQHLWYVPCPKCSRKQVLNFKENIEPWLGDNATECKLHCKHCKKAWTDEDRWSANSLGVWRPENVGAPKRGYHISQLSSPTKTIEGFMINYYLGQMDAGRMRAFHNNNQGIPYVAAGDMITAEMLDKCRRSGTAMGGIPDGPVYVGVDVGHDNLYVKADFRTRDGKRVLWHMALLRGRGMWQDLRKFLNRLTTFICVIDAHPAKQEVEKLSLEYPGRVWMGFEMDTTTQPETANYHAQKYGEVGKVTIDRTMAFDTVIQDYLQGMAILPSDARTLGEQMPRLAFNGFYHQMTQMVRVEAPDANEIVKARWKKNKSPDHWHHADMFLRVASMKEAPTQIPAAVGALFKSSGGVMVGV